MKKHDSDHDYSYRGSHHQCNYTISILSTTEADSYICYCLLTPIIGYSLMKILFLLWFDLCQMLATTNSWRPLRDNRPQTLPTPLRSSMAHLENHCITVYIVINDICKIITCFLCVSILTQRNIFKIFFNKLLPEITFR